MERCELLNRLLMPLDRLLDLPEGVLRATGLYERLQGPAYYLAREVLGAQYKLLHHLEVEGAEQVPARGGAVLAVNHQSWLDATTVAAACPRRVHFVAKRMLYDFPFLRRFMPFMGTLPIVRGGDEEGLRAVVEALRAGKVVAIFPEGTIPGEEDVPRTAVERRTGLLRGKTGAVRAALQAGVPIVPVGISGTGRAFPPEMYPRLETLPVPRPEPITVRFGEPLHLPEVAPEAVTREFLREQTDRMMLAISRLVDFSRHLVPMEVPLERAPWDPPRDIVYHGGARPGRKKPLGVLVLHGFTSSIHTVDGLGPHLRAHKLPHRMPHLRGHGTYFRDMLGTTAADWYDDAETALDRLLERVDSAVVVGLSMGGLLALKLAARRPESISGVVAVAPALRFTDPLAPLAGALAKLFPLWPSPHAYKDPECAKRNTNYPYFSTRSFATLLELSREVERMLPAVKQPLLVLQHRANQVVHPKSAEIILERAGSRDKRVRWFLKSGHEMMLDLEADAVFEAIIAFILERAQAGAAPQAAGD